MAPCGVQALLEQPPGAGYCAIVDFAQGVVGRKAFGSYVLSIPKLFVRSSYWPSACWFENDKTTPSSDRDFLILPIAMSVVSNHDWAHPPCYRQRISQIRGFP
jgi:hypothetical protein